LVVAADSQGKIESEVNAVGVAQFHLRIIPDRAKDADIGDDPLPGSYDRDKLLGGEFAFLVKIFQLSELGAGPEKNLQIFLADVHVAGGNIHNQRMRRTAGSGNGRVLLPRGQGIDLTPELLAQNLADQPLDLGTLQN
jgi:hypothetical protein